MNLYILLGKLENDMCNRFYRNIVKGTVSSKMSQIHLRHRKAYEIHYQDIHVISDNLFSIDSNHDNKSYDVKIIRRSPCCRTSCNYCWLCIHMISCNCADDLFKQTICKHCHSVAMHYPSYFLFY